MPWSVAEIEAEIATTKTLLAAINAALSALADPTISSYTIDTGQTRQVVHRVDLFKWYDRRMALMNDIATLEARITSSQRQGVPAW